jgi:lipopolysaccharide-induced tumor necrosis factor-alpha factor
MHPYAMQQQFTGSQTQLVHPGVQLQMTGAGYPLQQQASLAHQQVFMPQQQGLGMAQPFGAPQQLFTAMPLASLGQGPAPADCPVCRQRTVTTVNAEIGKTTQYVVYIYLLSWAALSYVLQCVGSGCVCGVWAWVYPVPDDLAQGCQA